MALSDYIKMFFSKKKQPPAAQEIASDAQEIAPDVQEIAPDIQEVAPDVQEIAPDVQEVAPEAQEITPEELGPCRNPWAGDMIPRKIGPGKRIERSSREGVNICGSVRLEWVSRETDPEGNPLRVRTPQSSTVVLPEAGFQAAGKPYANRSQLVARQGKGSPWAKDIYGRDVLVLSERFPCFDSEDLLYEERYFRWYFLCQDGKLTCVYHTDNTSTVTVTEDVMDVEGSCWKEMKKAGAFG